MCWVWQFYHQIDREEYLGRVFGSDRLITDSSKKLLVCFVFWSSEGLLQATRKARDLTKGCSVFSVISPWSKFRTLSLIL